MGSEMCIRDSFLSGQYLYDYEPISDDPDANEARSFPCTEFTVRRHRIVFPKMVR